MSDGDGMRERESVYDRDRERVCVSSDRERVREMLEKKLEKGKRRSVIEMWQ